jgi:hypothetical protein
MFISPVSNGPLVVDVDGDGICDGINPSLVPITIDMGMAASNQALSLALVGMPPAGTPDFFSPTTKPPGCDAVMTAPNAPDPLCLDSGTPMFLSIASKDDNVGNAAIFTIPPLAPASFNCVGQQLDTRNNLPEGPACVAAIAKDSTGNWGVSQPIRICIDRGTGMCAGWPKTTGLPECTGTVKAGIPPTTTCTAPGFTSGILYTN